MSLHWDQTLNVSSANRTSVLSFNKTLSTIRTNAQVTARHHDCILLFVKTHQALLTLPFIMLHINNPSALFHFVLLCHPVDCLNFERQPINQHYLLKNFYGIDDILTVKAECAVADHRVWLFTLLVVDRNDKWEVATCWFD